MDWISVELEHYINHLNEHPIDDPRRDTLEKLGRHVVRTIKKEGDCKLIFICTHNSRRSQFARIWTRIAAQMLGLPGLYSYSGGVEKTEVSPKATEALKRAGLEVEKRGENNPVIVVKYSQRHNPIQAYSKVYTHHLNPQEDFTAVITCPSAVKTCKNIEGANKTFEITYNDPKDSEGTEEEIAAYDNSSREIAAEVFYLVKYIKGKL